MYLYCPLGKLDLSGIQPALAYFIITRSVLLPTQLVKEMFIHLKCVSSHYPGSFSRHPNSRDRCSHVNYCWFVSSWLIVEHWFLSVVRIRTFPCWLQGAIQCGATDTIQYDTMRCDDGESIIRIRGDAKRTRWEQIWSSSSSSVVVTSRN